MKKLSEIIWAASRAARQRRAASFRQRFNLNEKTRILDVGSENGENINLVLNGTSVSPENVWIADIEPTALEYGRNKFGYQTVLLDGGGAYHLPRKNLIWFIVLRSSNTSRFQKAKSGTLKVKRNFDERLGKISGNLPPKFVASALLISCKRRIADF